MEIRVQSIKFDADQKLLDFVEKKFSKLERFHDGITSVEVVLSLLNDNLREAAELRLKYPDMPLNELGRKCVPPVGKSGINHRLRKIGQIADSIRES